MDTTLRKGDVLVLAKNWAPVVASDLEGNKIAIFVHGFTANGKYMQTLADYFERNGFLRNVHEIS